MKKQAIDLARRLLDKADLDDAGKIQLAYRLSLGRSATTREIERVQNYLVDYEAEARAVTASTPVPKAKAPPPDKKSQPKGKDQSAQPRDPKLAAWSSFCQALMGSAEFRYVK